MKLELSENEKKVLEVLANDTDSWGERCIGFDWIMEEAKLTRKEVQKACKVLREHKLVHFYRGLMTDDGEVAGSGYCVSGEGKAYLSPCDKCSDYAMYEWWEDEEGKHVYTLDKNNKHIRRCEKHYKEEKAVNTQ